MREEYKTPDNDAGADINWTSWYEVVTPSLTIADLVGSDVALHIDLLHSIWGEPSFFKAHEQSAYGVLATRYAREFVSGGMSRYLPTGIVFLPWTEIRSMTPIVFARLEHVAPPGPIPTQEELDEAGRQLREVREERHRHTPLA